MDDYALERYRQRYETWRHLDKVRYQIVQATIALIAAAVLFASTKLGVLSPLVLAALSVAAFVFWKVLARVNDAIVANGMALRKYALEIGDDAIPDTANRVLSVFYYLEYGYFIAGLLLSGSALLGLFLPNLSG